MLLYNLKIIRCGNRLEIYKVNDYVIRECRKRELVKIEHEECEREEHKEKQKQSKKDRLRNLTDTRNNIIRLIKCNPDMQTFITLTFAKEQDYKESKKALNIFFTKLRKDYSDLKYLWVLEYGEVNNRLHYHVLCNYEIDIKLSNSNQKKSVAHKQLENEFQDRYWKYGFVDIRQLQEEGNTNIALYVSTYIVKSLGNLNLEGYRVYGYSRKTLDKPVEQKLFTTDRIEDVLKAYSEDYIINYSNSYRIGYTSKGEEHKGIVTYFDMQLK